MNSDHHQNSGQIFPNRCQNDPCLTSFPSRPESPSSEFGLAEKLHFFDSGPFSGDLLLSPPCATVADRLATAPLAMGAPLSGWQNVAGLAPRGGRTAKLWPFFHWRVPFASSVGWVRPTHVSANFFFSVFFFIFFYFSVHLFKFGPMKSRHVSPFSATYLFY